jgi:hypothetical protein
MNTMNGHARDEAPTAPVMVPFAIPPRAGPAADWPPAQPREQAASAIPGPAPVAAKRTRHHPWPLLVIAAPAAVAIWSGWVGLGGMCGFGPIHPMPGIADSFTINTAITLPIGVEAYGAYALAVWLGAKGISAKTRLWARSSAVGALALGCLGQVAFHLLSAARWVQAPWPVVTVVSCLPVVSLALAAALAHMIRADVELDIQPDVEVDTSADDLAKIEPSATADIEDPPLVDIGMDSQVDKPKPAEVDKPRPAVRTSKRTAAAADKVTAVLRRDPSLSNVEVAKRAGVSAKTVQRTRQQLAGPDGG